MSTRRFGLRPSNNQPSPNIMAAPKIITDGQMAYGSRLLTIGAITYKANNFNVTRPVTEAKDSNPDGTPGRRRATADWAEFNAELQLPTGLTAYPGFGDTFTVTVDNANYGAETWVLDPVPHSESNGEGEIRVVRVTGKKVLNGSITKVA